MTKEQFIKAIKDNGMNIESKGNKHCVEGDGFSITMFEDGEKIGHLEGNRKNTVQWKQLYYLIHKFNGTLKHEAIMEF